MGDTTVGLAERMLALPDQAAVPTTYKYALLLALIDAALRGTDEHGEPPDRISVSTLAQHTLELDWPHTLGGDLQRVAAANRWESAPDEALGVARALYLALGPANLLWSARDSFVPAELSVLRTAFS